MSLSSLPSIGEVIALHQLNQRKSLGQHFLCDLNITRKIVRLADVPQDACVLEVGPGPGGLTRAILEHTTAPVIAIEKDRRVRAALESLIIASEQRLELIEGDALKLNPLDLPHQPQHIIANLPYNIGTDLLLNWIRAEDCVSSITVMLQQEVVDRLLAKHNTAAYGRLSVLAQWRCELKQLMTLPPSVFTPPPKVQSAVVQLRPRHMSASEFALMPHIEKVSAELFGQRRKMIGARLKKLFGDDLSNLPPHIQPTLRAEQLSVADYVLLATLLQ